MRLKIIIIILTINKLSTFIYQLIKNNATNFDQNLLDTDKHNINIIIVIKNIYC